MSTKHDSEVIVNVEQHTEPVQRPNIAKRMWSSLYNSFNLKANFIAIFKRPERQMEPLDGIRSLGFMWVLLIHSWKALMIGIDTSNPVKVKELDESHYTNWDFFSRLADKGGYGVDMFFVLSGFLISFLLIKEYKKNETQSDGNIFVRKMGIDIPRFYIRRALRIIPAYWTALGFLMLFGFLLFDKNSWPYMMASECATKFWQNMLFINNIVGSYNTMCLVPSWSIAGLSFTNITNPIQWNSKCT
jgi:peptidoglycan/LPS O-acetylase OafA/YrhL